MVSKRKQARGSFIVFEGIDGAGTTTQAKQVVDWLIGRGERVRATAEPSTGPIGSMLRQILGGRLCSRTLKGDAQPVAPDTVALLFAADRLDHLQTEIVPYLEAGYHVVCDRYVVSSLAYQSIQSDLRFVRSINDKALAPDVTLFLRVRPEVAMGRIEASRLARESFETLAFQRQVADRYEKVISEYRDGRVVVIDGEDAAGTVTGKIRAELERLL